MPYMTSVERFGMERGLQQGLQQGLLAALELGLELKFGAEGLALLPLIAARSDLELIQTVYDRLKAGASLDELRRVVDAADAGAT